MPDTIRVIKGAHENMLSNKIKYAAQVALMLIVFFIVLSGLIYKFVGEIQTETMRKRAEQIEKERAKTQFITNIDTHYNQIQNRYQAEEYDKALEEIKAFEKYGKSDYKELSKIQEDIRLAKLRKKLDFIPKIDLEKYINSSKTENPEENTSTQVFIRTPRYGQYFFSPSDFPVRFEGISLSLKGDFSDDIIWTSSIDGELGKGQQLSVRLSIGEHQITATGTNGITSGSMETLIYVWADDAFIKWDDRK